MFGSTVLEIAVGLIFIYLVLSLVCTSVNEYIAQHLSLRAEGLYWAIHSMFGGPDAVRMTEDLYDHAVIRSLRHRVGEETVGGETRAIRRRPSYIPPSAFSLAVTD